MFPMCAVASIPSQESLSVPDMSDDLDHADGSPEQYEERVRVIMRDPSCLFCSSHQIPELNGHNWSVPIMEALQRVGAELEVPDPYIDVLCRAGPLPFCENCVSTLRTVSATLEQMRKCEQSLKILSAEMKRTVQSGLAKEGMKAKEGSWWELFRQFVVASTACAAVPQVVLKPAKVEPRLNIKNNAAPPSSCSSSDSYSSLFTLVKVEEEEVKEDEYMQVEEEDEGSTIRSVSLPPSNYSQPKLGKRMKAKGRKRLCSTQKRKSCPTKKKGDKAKPKAKPGPKNKGRNGLGSSNKSPEIRVKEEVLGDVSSNFSEDSLFIKVTDSHPHPYIPEAPPTPIQAVYMSDLSSICQSNCHYTDPVLTSDNDEKFPVEYSSSSEEDDGEPWSYLSADRTIDLPDNPKDDEEFLEMQNQDLLDWLEESGLPPDTTPEKYYVEAQDSGYGLSFLPYHVHDKKATRKRRKKIQQGDEKA